MPSHTQSTTSKTLHKNAKPLVPTRSSYDDDPFANMETWVDYQEKIQLLKTTIAPLKRPKQHVSTKQNRQQQPDNRYSLSSNFSVISSGSSSCSDDCITPPRSISPTSSYEEEPQGVTTADKVRFISFLRQHTGWNTKNVIDLDYVESGGSLFWYTPMFPSSSHDG
ncbi:hypothetical protein BC941DRAFT_408875 [Chlamydoabsidia padenii]|nr:hypothetical protein BC941DRAFT_408875 [Chlamydoabsidia padenii]